jgi:hypothetical protein
MNNQRNNSELFATIHIDRDKHNRTVHILIRCTNKTRKRPATITKRTCRFSRRNHHNRCRYDAYFQCSSLIILSCSIRIASILSSWNNEKRKAKLRKENEQTKDQRLDGMRISTDDIQESIQNNGETRQSKAFLSSSSSSSRVSFLCN